MATHGAVGSTPADLGLLAARPAEGPVVPKVHLREGLGEVLGDPPQRGLPNDVLAGRDHHQVARLLQPLQTVEGSCRRRPD